MTEMRTKMYCDVTAAAAELRERDNILVISHRKPDGDTSGSGGALCHALKRLGKTCWMYRNPELTERLLEYTEDLLAPESFVWDYVVSVDVPDLDLFPVGFSGKIDLCIDHHPSNSRIGEINCIDSERASCAEVVLGILEKLIGNPDSREAELLYIGLSTDCGCFRYGNTDEAAHLAAAKLIACGADTIAVNKRFFETVTLPRIRLEGMLYSGFEFYRDGAVAVSVVTQEMIRLSGASEDDMDSIASLPVRVDGVEVGVTIREQPDGSCRVSARSVKAFSCTELCRAFGGGGHVRASGCTVNKSITCTKELLLAEIDRLWNKYLTE